MDPSPMDYEPYEQKSMPKTPWRPSDEERKSISNQTDVSLTLTKHVISKHSQDRNLVFSPLSIQILLGLIASGANPQTLDELLAFLKFKSIKELNSLFPKILSNVFSDGKPFGGPCLSSSNGIWVDKSYTTKPNFEGIVEDTYKAASFSADFNKAAEVIQEVNQWAAHETRGLIKEILAPNAVNEYTKLILANALYFKAEWLYKFPRECTRDGKFFLLNGNSIDVPFMHGGGDYREIGAFDGFKVLKLPYKEGYDTRSFSMYFYLPDAKDGLLSLVERLCSERGFLECHHPYKDMLVSKLYIPKFKISFRFQAKETLEGLKLVSPFSGDALSEMVYVPEGMPVYVDEIYHKAFIEVNEEFTEAAAVSATAAAFGSAVRRLEFALDFVADHPFLFVIREHKTNLVLFIGQVLNPLLG